MGRNWLARGLASGSFGRRRRYGASNPFSALIGAGFMGIILIIGGIISFKMVDNFWLSFGLTGAGVFFIAICVLSIVFMVKRVKNIVPPVGAQPPTPTPTATPTAQ